MTTTLNHYIVRLAERIGKPITFKNPIVDSTLPDGSRINIVFGGMISVKTGVISLYVNSLTFLSASFRS